MLTTWKSGEWNRTAMTGVLVCPSEVCTTAAQEDDRAMADGRLGAEAEKLIGQTRLEHPLACAYCGLENWELHKADAQRRAARGPRNGK